jgi:hypothetical protein
VVVVIVGLRREGEDFLITKTRKKFKMRRVEARLRKDYDFECVKITDEEALDAFVRFLHFECWNKDDVGIGQKRTTEETLLYGMTGMCRAVEPQIEDDDYLLIPVPVFDPSMTGVKDGHDLSFAYPYNVFEKIVGPPPGDDSLMEDIETSFGQKLRLVFVVGDIYEHVENKWCSLFYCKNLFTIGGFFKHGMGDPLENGQMSTITSFNMNFVWGYVEKDSIRNEHYPFAWISGNGVRSLIHIEEKKHTKQCLCFRYEPISEPPYAFMLLKDAISTSNARGLSVFSLDKNEEKKKIFITASYSEITRLRYILDLKRMPDYVRGLRKAIKQDLDTWINKMGTKCINEIILDDFPTKPFVDLDYDEYELNRDLFNPDRVDRITESVIHLMTRTLELLVPKAKISRKHFIVLDSSRPQKKISRHIIYDGAIYLGRREDVKYFANVMKHLKNVDVVNRTPEAMNMLWIANPSKNEMCYFNKHGSDIVDLEKGYMLLGNGKSKFFKSVIDWGVYNKTNGSLRIYDCIKMDNPDYPLRLVEKLSKPVKDMLCQHDSALFEIPKFVAREQAILYSSLLQYAPTYMLKEADIISVTDGDSSRILNELRTHSYGMRTNVSRKLGFTHKKSDKRKCNVTLKTGKLSISDHRKRKLENKTKRILQTTGKYASIHEAIVIFLIGLVKGWYEQYEETLQHDHRRVKVTIRLETETTKKKKEMTENTIQRKDKTTIIDSISLYPSLKFCPIKGCDHRNSGKNGMVINKDGSYFFTCLSSRCRATPKTKSLRLDAEKMDYFKSLCNKLVDFY